MKKINKIKPLLFIHRNSTDDHIDSMLVISITAKMQDYLQDAQSKKLLEGSKKYKNVETVWTFTLDEHSWKVSNIEESSMSVSYAKLIKELPAIESTLITDLQA